MAYERRRVQLFIVESGTIRSNGYGFLLVFYSNFVPKMDTTNLCNDPGQDVNPRVPQSPSSIIWFWPNGRDVLRLGK